MVAETKVQYICEENLNAPNLPNTWNSLIGVLDAALVNGLNLPSIDTVEIDGSVIFINFSSAHKLKMFQVISLSGFTPIELNAKWRIIGVPTTQQIAIDKLDNIYSITTVGQARLPSLGYEKTFSAVGKGVYRNADENAEHRPFLRVDATLPDGWTSTYAKFARVALMTECTDIDDISSQYQLPYDPANPEKNWKVTGSGSSASFCWAKWLWSGLNKNLQSPLFNFSTGGLDGNRKWMIVGDEKAFYLVVQDQFGVSGSLDNQGLYGFGVYDSDDASVIYPYFLASNAIQGTAATNYDVSLLAYAVPFCGAYEQNQFYNYRDCTNVLTLTNTGGTTAANTYFGKHGTGLISGNVTAPHYVQLGSIKGKYPHIYVPFSNFSTAYNATKLIDSSMFVSTPVYYRQDAVVPSWSQYFRTTGMPFYLGEL